MRLALALALCMSLSLAPAALAADADTNTLYYQSLWSPDHVESDPLVLEPDVSYAWRFYTDADRTHEVTENLTFVPNDDASAGAIVPSRGTELDMENNEVEIWYIYARSLGTGTLTYTENGTTYTLAVSCVLPPRAFTTEPTITETSILRSRQRHVPPQYAVLLCFPGRHRHHKRRT